MSLRSTTYQHSPPSTPPHSTYNALNSYPLTPPSPQAAQRKHQAQLASYRRDPSKITPQSQTGSRYIHVRYPSSGGRRPSAVIEEGATDGQDSGRRWSSVWSRGWRLHLPLALATYSREGRKSRYGRMLLYAVVTLILYITLFRSTSQPTPNSPSLGSHSIRSKPVSTSHSASSLPLRQKHLHRAHTRAALPPGVASRSLPDHEVRGGFLRVDPDSKIHPIYQLIRDARTEWDNKVAKQSKTLKEAVAEYKRRYGRNPPKGFDKWWDYVVANNVQLPDEYDRINSDLAPFFALSPKDLKARISSVAHQEDTYTLRVQHGNLRTSVTYDRDIIQGADERLLGQVELMKPIVQWLPDMSIVYSVHDSPSRVLGWDHRRELMEHIEDGEWIDKDDEIDLTLRGWSTACPPNSPLRIASRNYGDSFTAAPILPYTSLTSKTFISNHKSTFSICDHPELVPLHGSLAGKNPAVSPLTPIFSLSKTELHADILGVPTEQYVEELPFVPWGERYGEKLLWRGSNTGGYYDVDTAWRASHRMRLVTLGDQELIPEEQGGTAGVTVLPAPRLMRGMTLGQMSEEVQWDHANDHYMDIAFTGSPIQCDLLDGTCDDLADGYRWESMMTHDDALRYKYIIDVDGNAWSARFKRLLASGSLILKSTIHPEWWTDRVQPWVHYVPVQVDYSDVYDILAFFRGDMTSRGAEQDLARDIAESGREWSASHWRKEDMTAYIFRLYLEWGRLVSDRRNAMDFVLDEEERREML